MLVIKNYQDFEALAGQELGTTPWLTITQEQINKFADATLDHQWIHTDPERAAVESPFKATIAHGYLTLSLIPHLWKQIVDVQNLRMEINYEIERLRFSEPVVVQDEVRLKVKLLEVANLRGITKASLGIELEINGKKKPAFAGTVIFLYHFRS